MKKKQGTMMTVEMFRMCKPLMLNAFNAEFDKCYVGMSVHIEKMFMDSLIRSDMAKDYRVAFKDMVELGFIKTAKDSVTIDILLNDEGGFKRQFRTHAIPCPGEQNMFPPQIRIDLNNPNVTESYTTFLTEQGKCTELAKNTLENDHRIWRQLTSTVDAITDYSDFGKANKSLHVTWEELCERIPMLKPVCGETIEQFLAMEKERKAERKQELEYRKKRVMQSVTRIIPIPADVKHTVKYGYRPYTGAHGPEDEQRMNNLIALQRALQIEHGIKSTIIPVKPDSEEPDDEYAWLQIDENTVRVCYDRWGFCVSSDWQLQIELDQTGFDETLDALHGITMDIRANRSEREANKE